MRKRRILLVDDDVQVTRTLALYLEECGGCDVRVENHGSRALAAARAFRPDLVVMDIMMPDADGGTLAAEFSTDAVLRGTPVVFLTALLSQHETSGAAREIGGRQFLAKPVDPERVLAYIEEYAPPAPAETSGGWRARDLR